MGLPQCGARASMGPKTDGGVVMVDDKAECSGKSEGDASGEAEPRRDLRVRFIIHEPFEAPGAYAQWAHAHGYAVSYTRLYAGDALPAGPEGIDLLIVMGGPQSPSTTQKECPYFDAAAEERLMRACAAAGASVVGVCLGAQLLGEAYGAACTRSPEREIGLFPIELTPAGHDDPLLADLDDGLWVGHWHGDMPGVTAQAQVLATSEGCPRQIIRYADRVHGFQCHLEFTEDSIRDIVAASTDELARFGTRPYVQAAWQLLSNDYYPANEALFGFLDRLAAVTPAHSA